MNLNKLKNRSLAVDILLFMLIATELLMDFNEGIASSLMPYERLIHWSVLVVIGIAVGLKISTFRNSKHNKNKSLK